MKKSNVRRKTFTLIEVLVVIVMMATMTVVTIPKITGAFDKPNDLEVTRDLKKYEDAAQVLVAKGKNFTEQNLNKELPDGLKLNLAQSVENGPYGSPYEYSTKTLGVDDFTITNKRVKNGKPYAQYITVTQVDGVLTFSYGPGGSNISPSPVSTNKVTLQSKIAEAEALIPGEYEDFTSVAAALITAKAINDDNDATQEEVDNIIVILSDALSKLDKLLPDTKIQALITLGYIPIATVDDLNMLRSTTPRAYAVGSKWETPNTTIGGLDKKYVQVQNIDLSSIPDFEPIGIATAKFTGTYDGNNNIISNLTINKPTTSYIGLFGSISKATLENIRLINGSITGKNYVGGLVGINHFSTIANCYATGVVTGTSAVDILSGDSYSTSSISNCYTTGEVTGTSSIGGLVGIHDNSSKITSCYSTGVVTGTSNVGGLVGNNYKSSISDSYSTSEVTGISDNVGGLVGYNNIDGSIIHCYATGVVTGTSYYVGGLAGNTYSPITNSYWDKETTKRSTSLGGIGYTTAQMKSQASYTDWDFTTIWKITAGEYPKLQWQP